MSDIIIRDLTTHEEYAAAEAIQRVTWGMPDLEIIPGHALHAMQHSGAALLGAFDGPRLVGFTFGVLSTQDTPNRIDQVAAARLKMYSVIAGVLPEYQQQNVGYRLKMAQRDFCLRIGVRLITWTYDPLFRPNAAFNIHRLGATCATYVRDLYGEMTDVLNAGGPSDRFKVDWWGRSPRVVDAVARAAVALTDTEPATDASRDTAARATPDATHPMAQLRFPGLRVLASVPAGAFRAPPTAPLVLDGAPLALPIPDDIAALRRADRGLALAWRHTVRAQMEAAFAAGYTVVDCLHIDGRQWCYILTRDDPTA